jgi:hypothetical protein
MTVSHQNHPPRPAPEGKGLVIKLPTHIPAAVSDERMATIDISHLADHDLSAIGEKLPKIEMIDIQESLEGRTRVTADGLCALFSQLTNLRRVDVTMNNRNQEIFTDEVLETIAKNNPNLGFLKLANCSRIKAETYIDVAKQLIKINEASEKKTYGLHTLQLAEGVYKKNADLSYRFSDNRSENASKLQQISDNLPKVMFDGKLYGAQVFSGIRIIGKTKTYSEMAVSAASPMLKLVQEAIKPASYIAGAVTSGAKSFVGMVNSKPTSKIVGNPATPFSSSPKNKKIEGRIAKSNSSIDLN